MVGSFGFVSFVHLLWQKQVQPNLFDSLICTDFSACFFGMNRGSQLWQRCCRWSSFLYILTTSCQCIRGLALSFVSKVLAGRVGRWFLLRSDSESKNSTRFHIGFGDIGYIFGTLIQIYIINQFCQPTVSQPNDFFTTFLGMVPFLAFCFGGSKTLIGCINFGTPSSTVTLLHDHLQRPSELAISFVRAKDFDLKFWRLHRIF